MRFSIAITVVLLIGMVHAADRPPIDVRVTADRVNLRARPSMQSETVAQVDKGDTLSAREIGDEWVQVAPPADVRFFVHADFVRDRIVDVARLNVRAGPGINYSETGALERGDKVIPVGEFADWLEIEPPPTASLWISREYIELIDPPPAPPPEKVVEPPPPPAPPDPPPPPPPPPPEPVEPEAPPPPPPPPPPAPPPEPPEPAEPEEPSAPYMPRVTHTPPKPRVPDTMGPPPEIIKPPPAIVPPYQPAPEQASPVVRPPRALQRMGLVPLRGQGDAAVYEGVLTRGSFLLLRPSPFRIVERGRGRVITLCYVMGNESQLDGLVGQQLAIHGREYWLQGTRHPVLVAERIVPDP